MSRLYDAIIVKPLPSMVYGQPIVAHFDVMAQAIVSPEVMEYSRDLQLLDTAIRRLKEKVHRRVLDLALADLNEWHNGSPAAKIMGFTMVPDPRVTKGVVLCHPDTYYALMRVMDRHSGYVAFEPCPDVFDVPEDVKAPKWRFPGPIATPFPREVGQFFDEIERSE